MLHSGYLLLEIIIECDRFASMSLIQHPSDSTTQFSNKYFLYI